MSRFWAGIFLLSTLLWGALPFVSHPFAKDLNRFSFKILLEKLSQNSQGIWILQAMRERLQVKSNEEILPFLEWGNVSKTDAVVVRELNIETGNEMKKIQLMVQIQPQEDENETLLDLAHELTHAALRTEWDPYDPKQTLGDYVFTALEGSGGEVEALESECKLELKLNQTMNRKMNRCKEYLFKGAISKDLIRNDFYKSGNHFNEIIRRLGSERTRFPHLTSTLPKLYSSTGHLPYPIALIQEYDLLVDHACTNSKNRMKHFQSAQARRSPAFQASKTFIESRCN